jgi:serine/threonine protein kinase
VKYSAGDTFARYILESPLGEGASGIVFRAHDPNLGRSVALKILRADGEPSARARLLREARAAARVVVSDARATSGGGDVMAARSRRA